MKLQVFIARAPVGTLEHHRELQQWAFAYSPEWLARDDRYPLSPALPFERPTSLSAAVESNRVRSFFENLLPEGQALDDAAAAAKVSKAETFGLIAVLGRETAGALEILAEGSAVPEGKPMLRSVTPDQLSDRIRARPHEPFTVWDGRVRLSIAGFQDKLAVYEDAKGDWYLVEGSSIASTHLLKPEPVRNTLAGMTSNERLCMQMASAVELPTARTRWARVPEPVLVIERFDRKKTNHGVDRLHCIDGCQALGLPVGRKYERPYGSAEAVKNIRDGARLPALFDLLRTHSPQPLSDVRHLLRWTIFQVIIGNVDAHAKNLSFFVSAAGLTLAPAYDLVCGLIYENIEEQLAMAIGDEFAARKVSAFDWAQFASDCALPRRLVERELTDLSGRVLAVAPKVAQQSNDEGCDAATVARVMEVVRNQAERLRFLAPEVPRVDVAALS